VPIPAAVPIRDALGLVRLLYAVRAAEKDTPREELEQLVAIGRELGQALGLTKYEEGSLGAQAAIDRAERALDGLARQVDGPLVELVREARARLRKAKVRPSRPGRPAAA
jgi:hypothetical protein